MTTVHCKVCGYDFWTASSGGGYLPLYEICPSCSIQYSNDDWEVEFQYVTYRLWRNKWVSFGMPFKHLKHNPPKENWNPKKELMNIGININDQGWEKLESIFDEGWHFIGTRIAHDLVDVSKMKEMQTDVDKAICKKFKK